MSRTYRNVKNRWYSNYENKSIYVDNCINTSWTGYTYVRVKKTDEEFKRDDKHNQNEYDKLMKLYPTGYKTVRASWGTDYSYKIYRRITSKYKLVKIDYPLEEAINDYSKEYDRLSYDGHINDTSSNTGFKKKANKAVRRKNKNLCYKILKDDWENESYPNRKDGKKYIWDFF